MLSTEKAAKKSPGTAGFQEEAYSTPAGIIPTILNSGWSALSSRAHASAYSPVANPSTILRACS
jgi:hypothetical protein